MLDLPFSGDQRERKREHLRCAREAGTLPVGEGSSELDDPARLGKPYAASERLLDLACAPALKAVDIRVVVEAPEPRHYGSQASNLMLELSYVAQRGARVVLV